MSKTRDRWRALIRKHASSNLDGPAHDPDWYPKRETRRRALLRELQKVQRSDAPRHVAARGRIPDDSLPTTTFNMKCVFLQREGLV